MLEPLKFKTKIKKVIKDRLGFTLTSGTCDLLDLNVGDELEVTIRKPE